MTFHNIFSRIKKAFKNIENSSRSFEDLERRIKDLDRKNEYLFWLLMKRDGEDVSETKKRVFTELPKATGELRILQKGNAYLLHLLKKKCEEAKVSIFLAGGTGLGTVRHQGFIPWDDDIDVGIFRADFERILPVIEKDGQIELKPYYCLKYGERFFKLKFKDADTFWVDVWIFDMVDSNGSLDEYWNKTITLAHACYDFLSQQAKMPDMASYCTDFPIVIPALDLKFDAFFKKLMDDNKWYNSPNGDAVCLSVEHLQNFRKNNGLVPKEEYLPIKKNALTFEGEHYDSVANMERLVVFQYGDYLSFPSNVEQFHKGEVGSLTERDWSLVRRLNL